MFSLLSRFESKDGAVKIDVFTRKESYKFVIYDGDTVQELIGSKKRLERVINMGVADNLSITHLET